MPVLDRLVTGLIGDDITYQRRGFICDDCGRGELCEGHWTVDGKELGYDEWKARYAVVERRLIDALSTLDWDRVILGAYGYQTLLDAEGEELRGVDIMLSMTEPNTLTDREKHIEDMRAAVPRMFETEPS